MKKKILLVDDIKEFRALLKLLLSGNYEVITAEDGAQALGFIESGLEPDVVVTDLVMPRMDGYQLIAKMKSTDNYKKIPIIVLSNVDEVTKKRKLKRDGVSNFLHKPFSAAELREGLGKSLSSILAHQN